MIFLVAPLIVRFSITANFIASLSIMCGAGSIVLLAATLGILTKGKKLFEVLIFMVAYANINGIPFFDYFGATANILSAVLVMILGLVSVSFFKET